MSKGSLVKRVVRKGIAVFEQWLKEEPTDNLDPEHYSKDGFAYRWMNAVTSRLLFETKIV
jgi:hypothetical protein